MDLFLQKLHLQSSILRYPPSLLGFEGQGPGSAMQNRDLSLLSARAPTKEGLFHPQRAEMRPPQTKPSSWDASVPELLVILFSTSWKLFEKISFSFSPDKKAILKAQTTSQLFSGQPKPPVIVSLEREREKRSLLKYTAIQTYLVWVSRQNNAAGCALPTGYFLIAMDQICNKLSI